MNTAFDPATYDPYAGWSPYREMNQRLNQANSAVGAPAVLDPEEINQMAQTVSANGFGRISELDDNEDARNLALESIHEHRSHTETIVGEHAGTQYDPMILSTMQRVYGLMAFDTRVIFPLSENFTWQQLSDKYLSRYRVCDVDVSIGCERTNASLVIAIKSGEFVCIYKTCDSCRKWFDQPDREHFRTRTFFDDLWDRG